MCIRDRIQSEGIVVEQVIRPTGLLDPIIEVRPSLNQIDDLMEEIQLRIEKSERVLVTTLTKRMAEELTEYLLNNCLLYTSGVNKAPNRYGKDSHRFSMQNKKQRKQYNILPAASY